MPTPTLVIHLRKPEKTGLNRFRDTWTVKRCVALLGISFEQYMESYRLSWQSTT